jgi:hypothetical protein
MSQQLLKKMPRNKLMAYNHGRRIAMASRASINFHLPLTPELHDQLREEAELSGQPATIVAREALRTNLTQRRKQRLHAEIAAFAVEHCGSELDLDKDLEQAGLEALRDLDS